MSPSRKRGPGAAQAGGETLISKALAIANDKHTQRLAAPATNLTAPKLVIRNRIGPGPSASSQWIQEGEGEAKAVPKSLPLHTLSPQFGLWSERSVFVLLRAMLPSILLLWAP